VLTYIREKYTHDSTRLYVIGMSMGGYGTLDFAGQYPEQVTAAVAMCGGGKIKYAENLSKVPLWIMHGKKDRAVPISESEKIVDAIEQYAAKDSAKHIFTVYENLGHSEFARAFYHDPVYDWLFSHQSNTALSEQAKNIHLEEQLCMGASRLATAHTSKTSTTHSVKAPTPATLTSKSPSTLVVTDNGKFYTVKSGDSLETIAQRYKVKVASLCHLNNLQATAKLKEGQKIRVG